MSNHRRRSWRALALTIVGATVVPFVIQGLLIALEMHLPAVANVRLLGLTLPVLAGFVFLERHFRVRAAWIALVYVPAIFWLLMMFSLVIAGKVYDLWL